MYDWLISEDDLIPATEAGRGAVEADVVDVGRNDPMSSISSPLMADIARLVMDPSAIRWLIVSLIISLLILCLTRVVVES